MMAAILSVGRGREEISFISQLLQQGEEEGKIERTEKEEIQTHRDLHKFSKEEEEDKDKDKDREEEEEEGRDREERKRREEKELGQVEKEKEREKEEEEERRSLQREKEGRMDEMKGGERDPYTPETTSREREERGDQEGGEVREPCERQETTSLLNSSHVATTSQCISRSFERKISSPPPHSSSSSSPMSEPLPSIDDKNGVLNRHPSITASWLASSSSKEDEKEKGEAKERKKSKRIERRRMSAGISPALPDCLVLYDCHFEGVEWLLEKQKKMTKNFLSSSSSPSPPASCSSSSKNTCNPRETFQVCSGESRREIQTSIQDE